MLGQNEKKPSNLGEKSYLLHFSPFYSTAGLYKSVSAKVKEYLIIFSIF